MILKKAFWLFSITVFLLIVFLPGYTKLQELRERNRNLEARIKRFETENYLLQEELKRAQDDPVYQEKIIREKMGVVRRGEIPVKIVPLETE
ncbi:MAG: septum formation initiator family protein [Candidatus Omnitrophica bacterium]|nr:septum formation initiator family protein [Candidatus Omnitrophota bacterium]MBU4472662.1 septum formation initiator family protein [Candidatus Omnitrophota bacterium]MCG2706701.1 septum formation initiator family protein [Candidatus Omnitrophota bacterium]